MKMTYSLAEINTVAERILGSSKASIFLFEGAMGAGKTTLIQALCKAMGVEDVVQSPTYPIVHHYASPEGPVYHFDLFRLKSVDEVLDAGLDDLFQSGRPCFIEWPEVALPLFDSNICRIKLTSIDENTRQIRILEH